MNEYLGKVNLRSSILDSLINLHKKVKNSINNLLF